MLVTFFGGVLLTSFFHPTTLSLSFASPLLHPNPFKMSASTVFSRESSTDSIFSNSSIGSASSASFGSSAEELRVWLSADGYECDGSLVFPTLNADSPFPTTAVAPFAVTPSTITPSTVAPPTQAPRWRDWNPSGERNKVYATGVCALYWEPVKLHPALKSTPPPQPTMSGNMEEYNRYLRSRPTRQGSVCHRRDLFGKEEDNEEDDKDDEEQSL
jgi:hypothetical protein